MKLIDPEKLRGYGVRFEIYQRAAPNEFDEKEEMVIGVAGTVFKKDDEGEELAKVGTLLGWVVHSGATRDDLDNVSPDLMHFADVLFDPPGTHWADWAEKQIGNGVSVNIVLLDRVEIDEAHRGRDLGLAVAWRFLTMFNPRGLALCKLFPLQLCGKGDVPGCVEAIKTLQHHGGRLGFQQVPGHAEISYVNFGLWQKPLWKETL